MSDPIILDTCVSDAVAQPRVAKARWLRTAAATALPVVLFILLRQQYMSTPQFAFRQFRAAMTDGDVEELQNYTSTRMLAAMRRVLVVRQRYDARLGLDHNEFNRQAEQPLNESMKQHRVRWTFLDRTHARAGIRYKLQAKLHAITPKAFNVSIEYALTKTERGWVCDNEEGSSVF